MRTRKIEEIIKDLKQLSLEAHSKWGNYFDQYEKIKDPNIRDKYNNYLRYLVTIEQFTSPILRFLNSRRTIEHDKIFADTVTIYLKNLKKSWNKVDLQFYQPHSMFYSNGTSSVAFYKVASIFQELGNHMLSTSSTPEPSISLSE